MEKEELKRLLEEKIAQKEAERDELLKKEETAKHEESEQKERHYTAPKPAPSHAEEGYHKPYVEEKPYLKAGAENTLYVFANIILVLGIIATLFCAFTLIYTKVPSYDSWDGYSVEKKFNLGGLITTALVFVYTLFTWAMIRVWANISMTLKEINKKIK